MRDLHPTPRHPRATWVALVALAITACGGGGNAASGPSSADADEGSSPTAPAVVLTDMQPLEHGFAFANFPSSWYQDEFVADDLVAMFGADPSVCVDGVAQPCELTAEAAAFARMVNQSRASGHCEGLVAVAQARFNERSDPPTAQLMDESETIKAIMRAFATQFIPEVRTEVERWMGSSLADKIAALEASLAEGKLTYSLGVYVEGGGHAILPYAIEYLTPTTPRIMIYDSNWPGRNRWVDVDLTTEAWSFSFSGDDPTNDPDLWTGDASRMDLTSIDSRSGSCPFCSTDVGVAKNVLLVRSSDLNWSVETEDGDTVTPANPGSDPEGVTITPVKGQSTVGSSSKRPSYDYMIKIPSKRKGTTKRNTRRTRIVMPGTTSVFALTPVGIAQISTPGNPTVPVEVGEDSFVAKDPSVSLSLASGNLVATASGPTASLEVTDTGLRAAVTTEDGQTVEVAVTPETPAAKIVADPEQGGVQVLAQASDGVVEKREIAADGSVTISVDTTPLNLNATNWEAPPGLESAPLPMLPSPDERNVNNPDYGVDKPYTPPANAVPASDTVPPATVAPAATAAPATTTPPATTPPSTAAPATTTPPATTPPSTAAPATTVPPTTVPPTTVPATTVPRTTPPTTPPTTAAPATTVPRTTPPTTPPTTAAPATTEAPPPPPPPSTTLPSVSPALSLPEFTDVTYGTGLLTVIVLTQSPAPLTLTSSNPTVAAITSLVNNTAQITVNKAGVTTLTVSQPAITGYAAATFSRTLSISKAAQPALTISSLLAHPNSLLTLTTAGGAGTGAVTFSLTNSGGGACELNAGQLSRATSGTCVVTASKAGDENYESVTSAPTTISFVEALHGSVQENSSMTLVAPAGMRFSNVLFASYGLPDGTAGNYTVNPDCHAADSVAIVSNSALGRTSVTLTASNEIFNDPCDGIVKRLSVSLELETIPTATATLTVPTLASVTYGAPPITLTVVTNSPAPVVFTSSDHDVATIASSGDTAQITIAGAGTSTITVSQEAITGFTAVSEARVLTVNRADQDPLTITTLTGKRDIPLTLATSGGSGTGAVTFTLHGEGNTACTLSGVQLSHSSIGTCTVVATKSETRDFLPVSSAVTTVTFTEVDPPGPVTNLSATLVADTASVTWTAATSADVPLQSYRLRYRRSDATTGWITLDALSPTSTSASVNGLVSGTNYDIEVAGVNVKGVGTGVTTSVAVGGSTTVTEIVPIACQLIVGTSPTGEECHHALLNPGRTNNRKYLNYSETTNQVWVDLGAAYHLTQFQIYTASVARRDPVRFQIYAANGATASLGTGALIVSGTENCPGTRTFPCLLHSLTPTVALRYIVIQFPEVRLPGDYMEVSRILLHGVRAQSTLSITSATTGAVGNPLTLQATGGSGTGALSYTLIGTQNDDCTLTDDQLVRNSAGTCTVVATRTADATFAAVCSAPISITFADLSSKVLLYEVTNPKRFDNTNIVYSPGHGVGATDMATTVDALGGTITRIYYRMELQDHQGVIRFVEVSFDPWDQRPASDLRVPDLAAGNQFVIQQVVENLSVDSNVTVGASPRSGGIVPDTGRTGYLEIWAWDYGPQRQLGHEWGAGDRHDSHDGHFGNGGYGSFQVHDVTNPNSPTTLLAWNRHNRETGADIGIGNRTAADSDWTFARDESLGTDQWKLQIRADITYGPVTPAE